MTTNETIESALASLGVPVKPNKYTGDKTDFIVYNYLDDRPISNADDTDEYYEQQVRINRYTQKTGDMEPLKKAIRRLMRAAGFSIMSTGELSEDTTGYTHIFVECSIGGAVDDD